MDDFGTGYSSLTYLLKFPFDKIKIDRSFVDGLQRGHGRRARSCAPSSPGAHARSSRSPPKASRPSEQADFLREIGCHQLQGYLFSRPMPEAALASHMGLPESRADQAPIALRQSTAA